MTVKPWALFSTDLPDDQVENGDEITVYGGRNVAIAVGEILTKLGCQVKEPYSLEEQGWEFLLSDRGRNKFACRVCSFHPRFRLLFEEHSLLPKGSRNNAAYVDIAQSLNAALERDPRFRDVTWSTLEEGPPEPDEFSLERTEGARDASAVGQMRGPRNVGPSRFWWRVLAFCMITLAAGCFRALLWVDGSSGTREENLKIGVVTLAIGVLALWAGFRRRIDRA